MTQRTSTDFSVLAISNPRSGGNKKAGVENFRNLVSGYPHIKHTILSEFDQIYNDLELAKNRNVNIIIINGGDGTLQCVLTFLKKEENVSYQPELVLLKAGTTSMGYGDVGYKGDVKKMLVCISRYVNGRLAEMTKESRQILRMTLPDEKISRCGMFFGAAAIYSGILYCRQNIHTKGLRGEVGPVMAMLRFLLDWVTVNKLALPAIASMQIDESEHLDGEYSIITATTLKRLLAGVYPYWGKASEKNTFAFSAIKRSAPKPIRSGIRIMCGYAPVDDLNNDYYRSYFPSRVQLDIKDGFTLDGELFGQQGKSSRVLLDSAGPVTFLLS